MTDDQYAPPDLTLTLTDEDGASCWRCHKEGPDEAGQPLRRECSGCKGQLGLAHLACIVNYAKEKNRQWDGDQGSSAIREFREPWRNCPKCTYLYQGQLAVDLATEFVAFTEEEYSDKRVKLESLEIKLMALQRMEANTPQSEEAEEAKEVAAKILELIEDVKTDEPPPKKKVVKRLKKMEALVYQQLGGIALEEGTKASAKVAMLYFGKYRDISSEIGNTDGIMMAERNINIARSQSNVDRSHEMFEKKMDSREDLEAIGDGVRLAVELKKTRRSIEAERLLKELISTSTEALGPDHNLTKRAESDLAKCKERYVKIYHQNEWKQFQALGYEDDGKTCAVKGPVAKPRTVQEEEKITFPSGEVYPELGTPIVCHGLEEILLNYLNGKIGDLQSRDGKGDSYKVHFEHKDIEECHVKRANLQILFDLPDE